MRRFELGSVHGRTKFFLVLAFLVCLAGLWLLLVHAPLRAARQAAEGEARTARAELVRVQNDANRAQSESGARAAQQKWQRLLEGALPEHLAVERFLAALARRAAADGLILHGVTPGEGQAREDGLVEQPLALSLSGDYFSLLRFLQGLADLGADGRFVAIRELRVREGAPGEGLLAELSLVIFALPAGGAD